jgi:hypothetical protein
MNCSHPNASYVMAHPGSLNILFETFYHTLEDYFHGIKRFSSQNVTIYPLTPDSIAIIVFI